MDNDQTFSSNEIILEFTAIGSVLRVSAMDPSSLTEVTVQGPINANRATLATLARKKLAFVMARGGRG